MMMGLNSCLAHRTICFFFFLSNVLSSFVSATDHLCRSDQKDALSAFKNEFEILKSGVAGERRKTESWKNNTDCCSWDGVTCNAESGEVIELDLSGSSLFGHFKSNSSLFRLQHLRSLNLASNDFNYSSIPIEFNTLSGLTRLNLSRSSFSGRIPTEILQLTSLVSLDISSDDIFSMCLDFQPKLFTEKPFLSLLVQNLTKLQELHLSCLDISSAIPHDFVNLSSLRSLHLGQCNLRGEFPSSVLLMPHIQSIILSGNTNLTVSPPQFHRNSSLIVLDLSSTSFSSRLPDSIGNLGSLETLMLASCNLYGKIPSSLGNLSLLTTLDLSSNDLVGEVPSSFGRLISLKTLRLASCNLYGKIPSSLGNLSHLTILDLSSNDLVGEVPSSVGNLNRLNFLDLSTNKLTGNFLNALLNLTELSFINLASNLFTGLLPSDMSGLSKLESFLAWENSFVGSFPSSLFMIPSLSQIALSENQLNGTLEFGNVSSSSKLQYLSLSNNQFDGLILRSISKLVNLITLDLGYLNMSTVIDLSSFSSLKSLVAIALSGNNVAVANVSSIPDFPSLGELQLSACNITEFPDFLKTQTNLVALGLSNNKIQGQVPKWLWGLPLTFLDLSHNSFSSFEGSSEVLHGTVIETLDISSNTFQGPFPIPPQSTKHLLGSKNNFTGEIPQSICLLRSLEILDLSNNNFSGSIPRCLGNLSMFLSVLNLRNNDLKGSLPDTFTSANNLRSVDVGHNRLVGELPKSFINCTHLEVLNMESNRINDTFPFWLKSLPELQVLVLRSNEFYGPIYHPQVSSGFPHLRIIDISHNHFTGTLPSDYFTSWTAMSLIRTRGGSRGLEYMGDDSSYYHDSMVLMNKGLEMELTRILTIYTAIDFSGNKLQGQIPDSIGVLKDLLVLNFSNNEFTGRIPQSLANLTELESLDLSRNKLSGQIPPELGTLSFLAYMNFSHNQLTGPIPQGTQFQSQPKSSFEGNPDLCGPPMDTICGEVHTPIPQQTEPKEEVLNWIAAAIGFAPGVVFGLTIGHIVTSYKHEWFVKIISRNKRRRTNTR